MSNYEKFREEDEEFGVRDESQGNDLVSDFEEDSMENALERFNLTDDMDVEAEVYEKPLLVEKMAQEVGGWLDKLGVRNAEKLESEKFLELCEITGIMPDPRTAKAAFTDIVLLMEEQDYAERSMTNPPDLEDLEEKCQSMDDLEALQQERTLKAHKFLKQCIDDPLLDLPAMIDRIKSLRKSKPVSFEEYEEIESELSILNENVFKLTSLEEVQERRELALRCMHWLLKQDYLRGFTLGLRNQLKNGEPIDLDYVAGALAGRTDHLDSYHPGIIELLMTEHKESMADGDKTSRRRAMEATKLRRLEQAKAICDFVFNQDIKDRIYTGDPIAPKEFKKLEFIRHSIYIKGNLSILDSFIQLLPGGKLQNLESQELSGITYPKKFSGRSLLEVFNEINTILIEHPDIDIDRITSLVEGKTMGMLTKDQAAELAVDALKVLEKLAYQHNHSVSGLVSE